VTPHPAEFARLVKSNVETVLANRFEIATPLAQQLGAAVVLKGAPTIVTASTGARYVSATGTAALGTGGSGDTLGGIIATLLAQGSEPHVAAACSAWIHGRAAELLGHAVRGVTLDTIRERIADAWCEVTTRCMRSSGGTRSMYPSLATLPRTR
jgi:NAD(P)H-hydrate epimerase